MGTVLVCDPTAKEAKRAKAPNPKVADLRGKVIGLRDGGNGGSVGTLSRFPVFMDRIEELLRERYEVEIVRVLGSGAQTGATPERTRAWEDFKARVDVAVLGLGT